MTTNKTKGQYYCPKIYFISISLEKEFFGNGQLANPFGGGSGSWGEVIKKGGKQ